jgi:hypothetical protein
LSEHDPPATRSFDLNVQRVLEHWTVPHALREIIANALDEAALTETDEPRIFLDTQGAWHIRDFGRGLSYHHLTQNENPEKLANPEKVVGKFGVGLKDAIAALDRHRIRMTVTSRHGQFTVERAAKHGFSDIKTLHVVVSPPPDADMAGTDVALRGVSEQQVLDAKGFFLQYSGERVLESTDFGDVIEGRGRIYVGGLLVAQEERFLFSYNVRALTKRLRGALNRERSNVGRSAYSDRVQAILTACRSEAVAEPLAADLARFATGTSHDEVAWLDVAVHACRILNVHRQVLFVTPSDLVLYAAAINHARMDGIEPVVVPENVRHKLRSAKDLDGNPIRDIDRYIEEWNDSFTFQFVDPAGLRAKERAVWDHLDAIFQVAGGRPRLVRQVQISETMRPDRHGVEVVGLWDSAARSIIVKRSQLRDLHAFASTILHELGHVHSRADHYSEAFEQALTEELGTVGVAAITRGATTGAASRRHSARTRR